MNSLIYILHEMLFGHASCLILEDEKPMIERPE